MSELAVSSNSGSIIVSSERCSARPDTDRYCMPLIPLAFDLNRTPLTTTPAVHTHVPAPHHTPALPVRAKVSVNGLLLKALQSHISRTNKYLPENSQINVSLHNGPRTFIVTGPPRSLYGLVTNLRKIRAPNGSDQSKVEFSKRKPVFNARFLVVGVPFHSQYLQDATDKVINEDLNGEELWTSEGLQIPVYHTEDGMSNSWLPYSSTQSPFQALTSENVMAR